MSTTANKQATNEAKHEESVATAPYQNPRSDLEPKGPTGKEWKIEFSPVTRQNVDCIKLLVNKTFPLTYNDGLYLRIATEYKDYTFLSYLDDIPVGCIACRRDQEYQGKNGLYVIILSVLPRYRRGKIGQKMVKEVIERAAKDLTVDFVYLHTPIKNTTAINFYEKLGFKKSEELPDYYKSFQGEENTAVILMYPLTR